MGAAAEAGVKAANTRLHPVEQGLGDFSVLVHRRWNELAGNLKHGAVHRQVVLTRRDDQVDAGDQAVVVDAVVVKQGAAGRFADAHRFVGVEVGMGTDAAAHQARLAHQLLDALQTGDDLDQARMVVCK